MSDIPFYYDYINAKVSPVTPNKVHQKNTGVFRYFQRYLLQKAMSVFKFNLPDIWDKNYWLYVLYCRGYIAVLNTQEFGTIPQFCTLSGYNVFYQPTTALIANPLLPDVRNLSIGTDCAIIKLMPDWGSAMDIVDYYAAQMETISTTFEQNAFNSKISYVFAVKDKAAGESVKKMFDKISSGDPAVVIDRNLYDDGGKKLWDVFDQNIRQNYIGADLLDNLREVENRFCTTVGIPNANTDKRERLISDEVNANNTETRTLASLWLEELRAGMDKANKMFGLSLSVDWRERGMKNASSVDPDGDV